MDIINLTHTTVVLPEGTTDPLDYLIRLSVLKVCNDTNDFPKRDFSVTEEEVENFSYERRFDLSMFNPSSDKLIHIITK